LPGKELLLYGSLSGDVDAGMEFGQAISFKDIAVWWVTEVLEMEDGRVWGARFNTADIPKEWGLYDTFFQLSTANVELFGVQYPPGIAFSTGLSIFGIDCSVTFAIVMKTVDGKTLPDIEWHIVEGLGAAEEIARRKLIEELLPAELIDPSKLTNDQRRLKEANDGLSFSKALFVLEGIELKNINFLSLAGGERPILVLKFKFFGVRLTLEIPTLSVRELYELRLWEKLEALQVYADTLFSLPDCLWDNQCYNDNADQYCKDVCDPKSKTWYGECPKISRTCYMDDTACFKCFGSCSLFQCWY